MWDVLSILHLFSKPPLYFTEELAINPLCPIEEHLYNNSFPGRAFVWQILKTRAHKAWKTIQWKPSSANLFQGHIPLSYRGILPVKRLPSHFPR